jgi:N6-adenosine-specific RNA methylase IME4
MQTRTRQQWAKHLEQVWTQVTYEAVERFFRLGRDIIQSKEELPHGEFIQMLKEVGMNRNTANSFMRIARCEMMDNVHHLLPPDWGTIVKLTRLDPAVFTRLVDDGALSPNVSRNEISRILRLQRVGEDERRVLNLKPLKGKFRTIILDPAWKYDDSIVGRAKPDYALQKIEQLQALDVRAWADEKAGCHLYLWTTNAFLPEATHLISHWGFTYRTAITWMKPSLGLGRFFRNSTEHVLFATLGDIATRPAAASIPTHFEAPRGEHSEKPEQFYEIVRAASYPPYGEANQRTPRPDFVNLYAPMLEAGEVLEAAE